MFLFYVIFLIFFIHHIHKYILSFTAIDNKKINTYLYLFFFVVLLFSDKEEIGVRSEMGIRRVHRTDRPPIEFPEHPIARPMLDVVLFSFFTYLVVGIGLLGLLPMTRHCEPVVSYFPQLPQFENVVHYLPLAVVMLQESLSVSLLCAYVNSGRPVVPCCGWPVYTC